ncbi:MAG: hypothetical protein HZB76_00940 [Chlamydiae bacterium]|nr:hypothetical protein [Chlamydiota bacterium]
MLKRVFLSLFASLPLIAFSSDGADSKEITSEQVSPKDLEIYKHGFIRSMNLFKDSLKEFQKATEEHKKAKLSSVMQKAIQIMNETAPLCLSEDLQKQKEQLLKDFEHIIHQSTAQNFDLLNQDIEDIQKRL